MTDVIIIGLLAQVSVQASCSTITAMTLDRYAVILHPMRSLHTRTVRRTTFINIIIWITSFLLHIPVAVFYELAIEPETMLRFCSNRFLSDNAGKAYGIYAISFTYVLPFVVMAFCYLRILHKVWTKYLIASSSTQAQRKRRWKITRMTMLVVVLFGICWAPIHIVHLMMLFKKETHYPSVAFQHFNVFCLCLSYSNSAINPFVYAFTGRSYRTLLMACLRCRRHGGAPGPVSSRTRAGSAQYSFEMNHLANTARNCRSQGKYTNHYIAGGRHAVRFVPD